MRTGGTPAGFSPRDRVEPLQQPIRLYLVPNTIAGDVDSRNDARLSPIGTLVPDKNGHGSLTFTVPALRGSRYAAAAWCPGCADTSFGRIFFTLQVTDGIVSRFRPLMLLRVETTRSPNGQSSFAWPLALAVAGTATAGVIGVMVLLRRRARPSG